MDEDIPIPLPRPPPHGPPSVAQVPTYQTGRTQYPLDHYPMQTAMGPVMWAGRGLGKWDPLPGYGVGPAAPYLSPEREGAYLRTVPMHNGLGYQMVLLRDNGVPIGGTPQTTPQYVTAGPIQAGYTSFVQPIMRAEQMPLGGGRPILANPSLGGNAGPWAWNVRQTLRGAGVYGGPYAWPYIDPPGGYKVIGTNEGGWPIFAELPQAPAVYPTQVEAPAQRADGNPGFPLAGAPLALAAVGAGLAAGGATAALSTTTSATTSSGSSRGGRPRGGRPGASERPTNPAFNPSGQGGQLQVPMFAASRNPYRNPAIWPFALGAVALGGAGYAAWRFWPRKALPPEQKNIAATVSKIGVGNLQNLLASWGDQQSNPKRSSERPSSWSYAYTYSWEKEPNPGPGYAMARQFRPDGGDCEPSREGAEEGAARSLGNAFWNIRHGLPTQVELQELANQAYSHVYPEGPYPVSSTDGCARRWMALRDAIFAVIHGHIERSRQIAAPKWWSAGGPSQPVGNPIPGSVGYNGYSHAGAPYRGPLSGGFGPYLQNPPGSRFGGVGPYQQNLPPPPPPPPPLPIDIECEVMCGEDAGCYLDCVLAKSGRRMSVDLPSPAQKRWAGFRSPRRFDGRVAVDNPCGNNPSCGCNGDCAGEAR